MYYKSKAFRNAKYLAWIRQQNCLVTGMDFTETDMVAHHVRAAGGGGMGLKPSDYQTIPLTALQHSFLHQGIEKRFYERFNIDVDMVMRQLLEKFLEKKGIALPFDAMSFEELEILANAS